MSSTRTWLIVVQAALATLSAVLGGVYLRSKSPKPKRLLWAFLLALVLCFAYLAAMLGGKWWKDELSLLASDNKNIVEVVTPGSTTTSVVSKDVADEAAGKVNSFQRPYQIEILKKGDSKVLTSDNSFLQKLNAAQTAKKQPGTIRFTVVPGTAP